METRFAFRTSAFVFLLACLMTFGWGEDSKDQGEVAIHVRRSYLILVSGSIGAAEKLNFLIDTGTVPTLVSRRLMQRLGLAGPELEIGMWGQRTRVNLVTLPDLRLGSIRAHNLQVFAIDMQPMEHELGTRLDAIVGLDAFAPNSFTVDFVRKIISFGAPATMETAIAMELRESPAPYVVLSAEIEGKPVHLLLDTGTSGLTLLDLPVEHLNLEIKHFLAAAPPDGLATLSLREIRMGGKSLKVKNAFLRRVPQDSLRGFDGFIGPATLGVRRMGVDFATKQLYIEVEQHSAAGQTGP